MNVQNSNINIRVPKRIKDKFIELTEERGLSYSLVLRTMILNYIKDKGEGSQYDVAFI